MAVVIVQDQDTIDLEEAFMAVACGDVPTGVDHAMAAEVAVAVVLGVALS